MRQIGQLITQQSEKSSEPTKQQDSASATLTAEHMRRLWASMGRLYGHKWLSSMGPEDDGTWLSVLRRFSEQQIRNGLKACVYQSSSRDNPDGWPPTLPQFVSMCCPKTYAAHKNFQLALPIKKSDSASGAEEIQKLRMAIK